MSKIKYRPQYTLGEVESIANAIKHSVESGNTDAQLPEIYNKLELFLYKCNMGINKPQKVMVKGSQIATQVAPVTQVARSASHVGTDSASDSPASGESEESGEDIESESKKSSANESRGPEPLSESSNTQLAAGDYKAFEELCYNKLKMFKGDESKLTEDELLAASAHKVNNRMDLTEVDAERANKYLMKQLMG